MRRCAATNVYMQRHPSLASRRMSSCTPSAAASPPLRHRSARHQRLLGYRHAAGAASRRAWLLGYHCRSVLGGRSCCTTRTLCLCTKSTQRLWLAVVLVVQGLDRSTPDPPLLLDVRLSSGCPRALSGRLRCHVRLHDLAPCLLRRHCGLLRPLRSQGEGMVHPLL